MTTDEVTTATALFARIAEEAAVIADLRGTADRLEHIQDAKRQLAALPVSAVREALHRRRPDGVRS